ncbi:histidine phosphatase family protein [Halalkalibacillus halophilus]|uniref:histidine phosphatase family protein n=1 Tax=Halalkalibacillus halophilus TaxID=392827 RepID=UPI0003FCF74C|nr:histidine phosphatase family protein [Halalkalibacillus halophilus]
MTTICLIRHGETDWNLQKRLQGATDIPLNQSGENQAKEVRDSINKGSWDLIITSPLSRALKTAKIVNSHMNLPLEIYPELLERSFGEGEGHTFAENEERFPNRSFPSIEPIVDFEQRVMSGIDRIRNLHPNKNVLVVAHGAVINIILSTLSQGEIGSGKTKVVNASLSTIHYMDEQWKIKNYNQHDHLTNFQT